MNTGVRLRTDEETFQGWLRAMPRLTLPLELQADLLTAPPPPVGDPGEVVLPPVVAASLALHGCAEVTISLRRSIPVPGQCDSLRPDVACFAIAGDLAASLFRADDAVEVGLFGLSSVVPEVIRLIPATSPYVETTFESTLEMASLQVAVTAPHLAVGGWQQTLIAGPFGWGRRRKGRSPERAGLEPVGDVHRELAADLRLALVDCLDVAR